MKRKLLEILACPIDKFHPLELFENKSDDEKITEPINSQKLISQDELLEPLMACYKSLIDCNMENIANGYLLDTIRRAHCFGINLLKLDIRQDSEKHLNAITCSAHMSTMYTPQHIAMSASLTL